MHEVLNELIEYKIVLESAYIIIHGSARKSLSDSFQSHHSEAD